MTIAEKVLRAKQDFDEVYQAGKAQGGGGCDCYDTFWDEQQLTVDENGNPKLRENYGFAFAGHGWTDKVFKPKYDMYVTGASYMFHSSRITNLKAILEKQGVTLDFSNSNNLTYVFNGSTISNVGVIDARKCPNLNYCLYGSSSLVNVEMLMINRNNTFGSCFSNNVRLKEIRFNDVNEETGDGIISANMTMRDCRALSKDSIEDVIEHLSATTNGLTVSFSKTAINTAFGIDVDDTSTWPKGSEYYKLRHSKDNWTFSYNS